MSVRHFDGSFSAGEMSPELYGRVDLNKFQQGLALARNFVTLPHGPAQNRAGTQFVRETKNSAAVCRLIPFSYSNTQVFAIEVGGGYFRFHTNGGVLLLGATPAAWSSITAYSIGDLVSYSGVNYYAKVAHNNKVPLGNAAYWYALPATGEYEVPSPYAAADVYDIHYTQSADVMTMVHPSYPPLELRRNGSTNWTTQTVTFSPTIQAPTGVSAVATTGTGTVTYQYVVTAIESFTQTESVSSSTGASPTYAINTITQASPGVFTTSSAHGFALYDYVRITGAAGMTGVNNTIYQVLSTPTTTSFTLGVYTMIGFGMFGGSGSVYLPLDTSTFPAYTGGGTVTKTTVSGETAPGVGVASVTNDLSVSPNKNTVSWSAVTNAVRYNVYKLSNGLFGYIGQTSGTSFVDQNITADVSRTPPVQDTVMASTNNYPSAVAYYEQRRCFAGTNLQPQNVWMTKSGTESNMNYAIPIRDDDRIAFRIAAREASAIKHLVPVTNLLALTPSTEWRIYSAGDVLAPSTVSVKAQSYIGSNNVTPVVVASTVLFSQSRGGRIRELSYDWRANGYVSNDISVLVPHLFDYTNIIDMAFSRAPYPTLWCVTQHGKLLGLTYLPDQQVSAWHQHDTGNGDWFEAVCCVSETPDGALAAEDMVYVVVRRTINGTTKRYVERLHTRYFEQLSDAFFVDCGASNFQPGTYVQSGTTVTCTVVSHGLTTGNTRKLDFSDNTLDGSYSVTVVDNNTFTITVAVPAANSRGTMAIVVSSPVSSISGLTWLEGRTVNVLADGAVMAQKTVASGTITLDAPATKVTVGLPITADLKTLPISVQVDPAFGQGRPKNVNKVWMRVVRSSSLFAGPNFDDLVEYKQRTWESYGSPPDLVSDEVEIVLNPEWSTGGQVCVRQTNPLPLTLTSMTQEVVLGG